MKLFETFIQDGITTKYLADEEGNLTISKTQDISEIIERNKIIADNPWSEDKSFKHVASVPLVVIQQWRKEGIDIYDKNDLPKIIAKLNSSEFDAFRTGGGNI